MKAINILKDLKPTEYMYKQKVSILAELIQNPDGGHIINNKLIKWADKVGIKTSLSCEDRTSWWTCTI